jgi:hypothetical protein
MIIVGKDLQEKKEERRRLPGVEVVWLPLLGGLA